MSNTGIYCTDVLQLCSNDILAFKRGEENIIKQYYSKKKHMDTYLQLVTKEQNGGLS